MLPKDVHKINYVELPQPNKLLTIEAIDYQNPYDYKALHRHDYFEIIMVGEGEGTQFIDFTSYDVRQGEIFAIYPGQVHLMKRNTANGLLIQFRKELFEHISPIRHYHLYGYPMYTSSPAMFAHLYDMALRIKHLVAEDSLDKLAKYKAYSYLQIILISLIELRQGVLSHDKEHFLFAEFLSLVTTHIHTHKKVSDYCELMKCLPARLNNACKASIGKPALELIHEELLLEIRRLLLLEELSFKEIAYRLNFDSPSNFNGFIKHKTGLTPKELQSAVREIYK